MNYNSATISDYVTAYNNEDLTHDKFYLKQVITKDDGSKMMINQDALYQDYFNELKRSTTYYTFTEESFRKYKYNPKLFSYDFYKTTEYWSLLLQLNEMHSVSDFDRMTILVFRTSITKKLNEIFNIEKTIYNINQNEISENT